MRQVLLIIAGLFFVSASFVLFATRARGPGLSPDSMSYLAAAESIARGAGPEIPTAEWSQLEDHSRLRHFPPLFPALLAAPVALGMSPAQAARWLEALAAGALAALLAWIAVSCVGRERAGVAALVAGTSVMLAPAISLSFFMVLSEPLFLTLWTLTLLVMVRAPTASVRLGMCAACCALTRYAGISVVAAVALWVLVQPGSIQERGRRALLAAAPGVVALGLWRVWAGGELRRYGWYLEGFAENAREAWETLRHALVPLPSTLAVQSWKLDVILLGLLAILAIPLTAALRARPLQLAAARSTTTLQRAAALMTVTYLAVIMASRVRADPEIPFDWRILSPLIATWQLTLSVTFVRRWHNITTRTERIAAATLALAWFAAASWNAGHNVIAMQRSGALYDAPAWQDSEFAAWLRAEGRQYALYTNNPPVLWHLDHRSSWLLPETTESATLSALRERLYERPSAVLGFESAFAETADPHLLAAQLGLPHPQCFEQVCVWTATAPMISEASR